MHLCCRIPIRFARNVRLDRFRGLIRFRLHGFWHNRRLLRHNRRLLWPCRRLIRLLQSRRLRRPLGLRADVSIGIRRIEVCAHGL